MDRDLSGSSQNVSFAFRGVCWIVLSLVRCDARPPCPCQPGFNQLVFVLMLESSSPPPTFSNLSFLFKCFYFPQSPPSSPQHFYPPSTPLLIDVCCLFSFLTPSFPLLYLPVVRSSSPFIGSSFPCPFVAGPPLAEHKSSKIDCPFPSPPSFFLHRTPLFPLIYVRRSPMTVAIWPIPSPT